MWIRRAAGPIVVAGLIAASLACSTGGTGSAPAATAPSNPSATPNPIESGGTVKAVAISPQGFPDDYSQIGAFFEDAASFDRAGVVWNGSWRDDVLAGEDAGTVPSAAAGLIQQGTLYGFTPVVVFGWRSGSDPYLSVPGNPTNDWSNEDAQTLFQQMLVAYAEMHPPLVFIGNENDFYYEQNPDDYAHWIAFYNDAYDAIKAVSPETLVGPVFNYEHLTGLGTLNNWTTPNWGALDAHDLRRVDIVGLSLYPWLGYADPADIPDDYLAPLADHIGDTPVGITETGWPAEVTGSPVPLWHPSEANQVAYVERLNTMLDGIDVRLVTWLFLYPMMSTQMEGSDEYRLFGTISLRDASGGKRPVYDAWASFEP